MTGISLSMTVFAKAATRRSTPAARLAVGLMATTMLAGMPYAALAQESAEEPAGTPVPGVQQQDVVRTISVSGAQRLE